MAIKIKVSKNKGQKTSFFKELPRFNLKLRALNRTVDMTYVPVLETIAMMIKDKKSLFEAMMDQINEFEGAKKITVKKRKSV